MHNNTQSHNVNIDETIDSMPPFRSTRPETWLSPTRLSPSRTVVIPVLNLWRYALDFVHIRGDSHFISSVSRRLHLLVFFRLLATSYRRLVNTFSSQNDNASSIKSGSSTMSLDEVVIADASEHAQETGSVLVTLSDTSTQRSKKHKRGPKGGDYKGKSEDAPEKQPKKLSPNYFVAIQVTNPEIHRKIGKIQEDILEQNGLLKHVLISLPTLHLTLMVTHLADDAQINSAKCALDDCRLSLLKSCSSADLPVLSVAGVGHFNDNVVFAKVDAGAELKRLETIAETVSGCFAERGFPSTDAASRGFQPHITILKMSKAPWLRKKGVKKIEPGLYSAYSAEFFGQQTVTSLQLCSMTLPKNKTTGYYHVAHEVRLVENVETSS